MLKIKTLRKYFWKITLIAIFIFFAIPSAVSASTIFRAPSLDGLIGYWDFNDGAGSTIAEDKSGQGHNGTLTLMDPSTDWVDGKVGSGSLDFDGDNDYVITETINAIAGSFTVSAWVKYNSFKIYSTILGVGNFRFSITASATGVVEVWINNGDVAGFSPLTTGTWYHIIYTHDIDSNTGIIYSNGVIKSSGTAPIVTGNTSFNIGKQEYGGTEIDGQIDDVRVYNRVLSAEEITNLYNSQKKSFPTTVKSSLSNGLVGYWNFDIGAGGSTVYDMSGNANHGTMVTMDPATDWVDGKVGSGALDFDGSNDYVDIGSQPDLRFNNGNFTLAGWIKPDVITETRTLVANYIDNNRGYFFGIFSSKIGYYTNAWKSANTTLSTGIWYHIAITIDSSGNYIFYLNGVLDGSGASTLPATNEDTLKIGAYGSGGGLGRFDGLIDEARVYNRALSAEEIQRLYKTTAGTKISKLPFLSKGLVGYWDFNDGAGSTVAKDKSGQGHNGTLTTMDPATDWVDGKVGSGALDFDGGNDFVDMGSQPDLRFNSGNFTLASWVKPDVSDTSVRTVVANAEPNAGYILAIYQSKIQYYSNAWKSANTTLSTGIWYHIAITIDSSGNYIFYLNGAADGSGVSTLPAANEDTFKIGAYGNTPTTFFDGPIDDVRIYKRVLSAEEIQRLYDLGNLKP